MFIGVSPLLIFKFTFLLHGMINESLMRIIVHLQKQFFSYRKLSFHFCNLFEFAFLLQGMTFTKCALFIIFNDSFWVFVYLVINMKDVFLKSKKTIFCCFVFVFLFFLQSFLKWKRKLE